MNALPQHLGIISLPFEVSTSFLRGTAQGASAILDELDALDSYDFDLAGNPFDGVRRSIIHPHSSDMKDPNLVQTLGEQATRQIMDSKGFPLILGGEHTVSIGPIRAARFRGDLGIVQLDAHADLRDEYEVNPWSHACAMRRAVETGCSLLGVGVRALCEEEAQYASKRGFKIITGRQARESTDWYSSLDDLPSRVYLTIDMDVFDPQEVPAVGTPEPGGPGYQAVADFLYYLFNEKNVVAADIVELRPDAKRSASVRLAARLAGLIVGLRFKS